MNKISIFGLIIGFGAIFLGNSIEGGHFESLLQGSAFLIVAGGTLGAVFLSNNWSDVTLCMSLIKKAFFNQKTQNTENINTMLAFVRQGKKEGLVTLEPRLSQIKDIWFKDILSAVVDGASREVILDTFEARLDQFEKRQLNAVKVLTDAGGFSPTIGIIGAVLGLIHVMANLTDTSKLGSGIAVAFVATIYGVSLANLLFLPLANKIKKIIEQDVSEKEMLLAGALGLKDDLSPFLVEMKMNSYLELK